MQQQCEEDMDLSIPNRLFMGAGAAAKGTIDTLIDEGDGNEGMKIAGGMYIDCMIKRFITSVLNLFQANYNYTI